MTSERRTHGQADLLYLPGVNKKVSASSISAQDPDPRARRSTHHVKKGSPTADGPEDTELVARARSGDHEAFRLLFQRYHRRVYSLAYGMVRNQDDALDVVQEGFIKAHRYLDRFEGASSFYTWLYRIIMNLCIDHIRKQRRARLVDFNDALDHGQGDAAVGEDALLPRILGENPGKALVRKEIREHIDQALSELSDNHRAVLIMRELDGMSYEEMAEMMQCAKGTIMSRLFHARKNMQKRLLELMGGHKDLEA